MQSNKILNDLLERGHNQTKSFDMFKEAEIKLMEMNKERNNNKNITKRTSIEETLELIKPSKKVKTTKTWMGQYYYILHAIQKIFP